jgi:CRP-like cAMP-binding protein
MTEYAHLLTADPDLGEGIPLDELEQARRVLVAHAIRLDAGLWRPRTASADGFALLVLRGALTREVHLGARRSAELVGPGDVVRPDRTTDSLLPHDVTWTVTEPTILAVLDERFRQTARRWPSLSAALDERLLAQIDRLAVHVAIAQLGRVDLRILALFWHLADRWGRVTSQGVALPLKLTHDAVGRLVGAQRPTVTLALTDLAREGSVTRSASGGWLLDHDSRALLESPPATLRVVGTPAAALAG